MGELLSYMLKSSVMLMAMYLIYKSLMANQKEHAFNRVTLLAIFFIALVAPILPELGHILHYLSHHKEASSEVDLDMPVIVFLNDDATDSASLLPFIIVSTYLLGLVAMITTTAISYIRLANLVRNGEKLHISSNSTLIISSNPYIAPFSWMKYIVMTRKDYNECAPMVITHELEHLAQHHWIDMLFAQLVIIFQWFNPAAWLMRDELRSVHEYQADAAVLYSGANARQYQLLLIKKAVGKSFPALANSLNHSKLKKRITMMLKSKPRKSRRMLALALAPAVIAAVAVLNIPAVTSALSSVANVKLPQQVSDHKVTNSDGVFTIHSEEIESSDIEDTKDMAMEMKSDTEVPAKTKETPKESPKQKYIITIDGKDVNPDSNGNFEYNGKQVSINTITNITPQDIKSMKVDRQQGTITINLIGNKENVVETAAKMPQFPGGDKALLNYVCENVHYPDNAPMDGKTYRVVVTFNISSTGKVGDAQILRSQGELFDAEALRVISTLPDFEPAVNENGENVSVMYTLPISFKTTGEEDK